MNKSDLVSKLTARLEGDRRAAVAAVNGVLEEIEQSLVRGEKVSLLGFGTFDRRERGPRTARNPATGESVQIGASVAPVFRAGAGLKSLLAQATGTANGAVRTAGAAVASTADAVPVVVAAAAAPAKEATKKALTAVETTKKLAKRASSKDAAKTPKAAKSPDARPAKAAKAAKPVKSAKPAKATKVTAATEATAGSRPKKTAGKAAKKK